MRVGDRQSEGQISRTAGAQRRAVPPTEWSRPSATLRARPRAEGDDALPGAPLAMRHPDHPHPATLARRAEAEALRRVAWQSCAADSPSPTIFEALHIEAGTCSPCPHAPQHAILARPTRAQWAAASYGTRC